MFCISNHSTINQPNFYILEIRNCSSRRWLLISQAIKDIQKIYVMKEMEGQAIWKILRHYIQGSLWGMWYPITVFLGSHCFYFSSLIGLVLIYCRITTIYLRIKTEKMWQCKFWGNEGYTVMMKICLPSFGDACLQ